MAFKDTLMTALHDAVGNFNAGASVDDAVVKAARANDFNVDQTTRLVETFNTARALYHYKSATDRASSCDLADAGVVISKLFKPETESKSKSKEAALSPAYSQYDLRERDYFSAMPQKSAESTALQSGLEGLSFEALSDKAMRELRSVRQVAKIAEDEARIAGMTAARVLEKVARLFAPGDDAGRKLQDDRYARLEATCSSEYGPVLSKLAEFIPPSRRVDKKLVSKYAAADLVDDSDLGEHRALLKEARDLMQAEAELLAASGQFCKEADAFERDFAEATGCLPGPTPTSEFLTARFVKRAAPEKPNPKPNDKSRGPMSSLLDELYNPLATSMDQRFKNYVDVAVPDMNKNRFKRENTRISENLRNVQRQILLQDLMVNDPVLSEEAPETVAQAYSAVMNMAPEVSTNKEVMRAILRQSVNSVAVSPYDAEMWTKLERNLANIRGGAPSREDKNV